MRLDTGPSSLLEAVAGDQAAVLYEDSGSSRRAAPMIAVRDLHKSYDMEGTSVHALRGVTLSIDQGEFVAIMGASGSGKSTFMNILGLLDEPGSGRYVFEGADVATLTPDEMAHFRNRRVGF